jgi:hypothetical protein
MDLHVPDAYRAQWRQEIAAESAWGSDRARRWVDLGAAVAVAAAVLDALVTYVLVGGSVGHERNPLVVEAMRSIGIAPTLTMGVALRVGVIAALAFLAIRAVRPSVRIVAFSALAATAAWWCAVVFANAAVVAHLV